MNDRSLKIPNLFEFDLALMEGLPHPNNRLTVSVTEFNTCIG